MDETYAEKIARFYEEIGEIIDREKLSGSQYHWLREALECLDEFFMATKLKEKENEK
jgi:hypothetical protein